MNFTFVPSLKHVTLVNIATTLWNRDDIRDKLVDSPEYFKNQGLRTFLSVQLNLKDKWSVIEQFIIDKVSQFSIPDTLKNDITACITPINDSVENWIYQIGSFLSDENRDLSDECLDILACACILPNRFCWTPQGMMDQKKTAEVLIKDERINFSARYRLACNYCLEADIPVLRNKIPEYERMDFYSENPSCADEDDFDFAIIWNYDLTADLGREGRRSWPSRYGRAFECAAIHGNKVATEYFFQKLTREERNESLINVAPDVTVTTYSLLPFISNVFCFLLSQMSEEQQLKVFQIVTEALGCFLEWPWQDFFLKTTYRVRGCFVKDEPLFGIMRLLLQKDALYRDYNYKMLLGEFWKQIPNNLKISIIDEGIYICFLMEGLFQNKDKQNMELIFNDATPEQRKKYSLDANFISDNLVAVNDWDFLKFFVELFATSKDVVIKFIEVLNQRSVKRNFMRKDDLRDKLLQLLNDLLHKLDRKRSMNEVGDCPAKRLCGNVTH